MKKFLLSFLLLAAISSLSAQRPCIADYRINNGGGNCADIVVNGITVSATGTVTLFFLTPVDPANIPTIASVTEITDPNNPVLLDHIHFGAGHLNNNGSVTYCYYAGPNNTNNLAGQHRRFRFSIFYRGLPCGEQIPLPVLFKAFTVSRSNPGVFIKWTTATESSNSGFEIQRLTGLAGIATWETIAFIPSRAVGGNSVSDLAYTYTDINNTKGIVQYRLRQIDLDGKYQFSEIRAVRSEEQKDKTIIYPNPARDGKVNIVFQEANVSRDISLSDMSGRTVRQMKNITGNTMTIDNLAPGIYTLRILVQGTGQQSVEKIVMHK